MKKTIYALVAFTCLLACRKEVQPTRANHSSTISLAEATAWYQSQANSTFQPDALGSGKQFRLGETGAQIEKAQSFDTKSGNFWLVPLEGTALYKNYRQGYRKLAIRRDSSGPIYARILEIIPDGLYLQRKGSANTSDFTGRVFVYDQHYKLLGGRLYGGGKLIGAIKPSVNAPSSPGVHTDNIQEINSCQWYDSSYVNSEGEFTIYSEEVCTSTDIDDGNPGGFDGGSGNYLGSPNGGSGGGPPGFSSCPQ